MSFAFLVFPKNILLLKFVAILTVVINGGSGKLVQELRTNNYEQETEDVAAAQNFQGTVFIYPTGIRSERDIPICSKKQVRESPSDVDVQGDSGFDNVAGDFGYSNTSLTSQDVLITRQNSEQQEIQWESACNIIHKRYFFPPVVERLCRCPERTECPWEYSEPPNYPGAPHQMVTKGKGRDPFTIFLSSRTQAKFCAEVATALPRCPSKQIQRQKTKNNSGQDPVAASLVRTIRKAHGSDEVPRVTLNCYCPPLYRGWRYLGQTEPHDFRNGTVETNYYYSCDKLPRCKGGDRCGNIRTDLHFSFYHCTCPKNHLCLPKVYPPDTLDVIDDVNEVLFRGQVAPAFCTPHAT